MQLDIKTGNDLSKLRWSKRICIIPMVRECVLGVEGVSESYAFFTQTYPCFDVSLYSDSVSRCFRQSNLSHDGKMINDCQALPCFYLLFIYFASFKLLSCSFASWLPIVDCTVRTASILQAVSVVAVWLGPAKVLLGLPLHISTLRSYHTPL